MTDDWYAKPIQAVFKELGTNERGLTATVAAERAQQFGPNELPKAKPEGLLAIFLRQFQSPLIYILLAAGVVVFLLGETADSIIIFFILLFNAIVGTLQEGRAQNTLRALATFTRTSATVVRDGTEIIIPDRDVVPGDLLVLNEGEKIPADARILDARALKIDESSLTGESIPVGKTAEPLHRERAPTAEQKNMVFKGTHIVAGNGRAVVVATGPTTAVGQIARAVAAVDSEIPLKANIRALSRVIIIVVAFVCGTLLLFGLLAGLPFTIIFSTVVSLAVSIIPEGLPIVMTLVLASGVWRMSRRHALVKRLQAVEALGQARIIAVDKTGTLTRNELVVSEVYAEETTYRIGGIGYESTGTVEQGGATVVPANHEALLFAGKVATLVANARVSYAAKENRWQVAGDPTEAALLIFGEKMGFQKDELIGESPLLLEVPFDYRLKYHATMHRVGDATLLSVIGAPEAIIALSSRIRVGRAAHALDEEGRKRLSAAADRMSEKGLRVVAYAVREDASASQSAEPIRHLIFGGLLGIHDALRSEVAETMQRAAAAGIKVVMITGDHKLTARAIAAEAGIARTDDSVLTGEEMDVLSDTELAKRLAKASVFARVTPEHKLRIIQAYRRRGEIVAMTGDGVNDAPSLVAADLGVAMGIVGTEVAKEAADIVLLDDNFGSIISAVEEGRSIYITIKKVILYLFSTSIGEALVILGALALGFPLPLLAVQILWLNFITDGFLDVALAMEPKEKGLLSRTFEHPKKYLVDRLMGVRMILMALPMMAGTLLLFAAYAGDNLTKAWTISLTTLAVFQWFNAWNCRSGSESVFRANPFSNWYLVAATVVVITLQLLAVYTPFLQSILRTTPLAASEWLLIIAVASSILVVEEARKLFSSLAHKRYTGGS
ncbi:HAD-IC family P-type ATPase [Candidatus Kaiserbacteria bacterium]|nr:HAD-IC family P-type ATPase [Candidatus Kaiserbacteria bacterium]